MSQNSVWYNAEYDYGYIEGWVVLRRGADWSYPNVVPPWKIYARVNDSGDARKIVVALSAK